LRALLVPECLLLLSSLLLLLSGMPGKGATSATYSSTPRKFMQPAHQQLLQSHCCMFCTGSAAAFVTHRAAIRVQRSFIELL
jgi:hypothetical protein